MVNGVHRTHRDGSSFVWHQPCHAVSTPLWWIFKSAPQKASHSCRITCKRSEPFREQRIALCKSDQRQQIDSILYVHIWVSYYIFVSFSALSPWVGALKHSYIILRAFGQGVWRLRQCTEPQCKHAVYPKQKVSSRFTVRVWFYLSD